MTHQDILPIRKQHLKKAVITISIFIVLLIIVFMIGLNSGSIKLSPIEVILTLTGNGTSKQELILYQLRLPRMIISILAGAGFAVSGTILQSISRNGLADPGILGINDGAGLFVLVYILLAPSPETASPFYLPLLAFAGSLSAAALIYLLAYKKGKGLVPTRLVLVGIAVGAALSAVSIVMTLRLSPENYDFVLQWNMGNLYGSNWKHVLTLLPWSVFLLSYIFRKLQVLNLLSLEDQTSVSLGIAIEKEKFLLLLTAVGLSASSVAIAGSIGFIGLIAPHLSRSLVGPRHQFMLPLAALTGSILVLAGDTIARSLLKYSELPAGLIITFIGAPYFLYLLIKS